jgi:hypothetical protein
VEDAKTAAIIKRIRALLSLAGEGSGTTPEEAASAMAKAQALCIRYNLELAKVRLADGRAPRYVLERFDFTTSKRAGSYIGPLRMLARALMRANYCTGLSARGTGHGYIIGEPHNVEMVRAMFGRLSFGLMLMATAAWERDASGQAFHRAEGFAGGRLASASLSWKRAFLIGAVTAIRLRVEAERTRAERYGVPAGEGGGAASGEEVRALAVVAQTDLDEAVARMLPEAGPPAPATYTNGDAFELGARAGAGVDLAGRPQLEGGE